MLVVHDIDCVNFAGESELRGVINALLVELEELQVNYCTTFFVLLRGGRGIQGKFFVLAAGFTRYEIFGMHLNILNQTRASFAPSFCTLLLELSIASLCFPLCCRMRCFVLEIR